MRLVDDESQLVGLGAVWRSAWRSIRKKAARNDEDEVIYPNLDRVRFHDLRHTAVTMMAEAGLPDQTIMAQVGHISPEMMKTYSHIRRLALNAAAAALEPTYLQRPINTQVDLVDWSRTAQISV